MKAFCTTILEDSGLHSVSEISYDEMGDLFCDSRDDRCWGVAGDSENSDGLALLQRRAGKVRSLKQREASHESSHAERRTEASSQKASPSASEAKAAASMHEEADDVITRSGFSRDSASSRVIHKEDAAPLAAAIESLIPSEPMETGSLSGQKGRFAADSIMLAKLKAAFTQANHVLQKRLGDKPRTQGVACIALIFMTLLVLKSFLGYIIGALRRAYRGADVLPEKATDLFEDMLGANRPPWRTEYLGVSVPNEGGMEAAKLLTFLRNVAVEIQAPLPMASPAPKRDKKPMPQNMNSGS